MIMTPGRRPLNIWGFVANINNGFILGLNILRAYDASVDIGRQTLRLAEEDLAIPSLLWQDCRAPRSTKLSGGTKSATSSA
jgi:hypothetical protein